MSYPVGGRNQIGSAWWRWPGGLGAQTWPDVWTVRTGAGKGPLGDVGDTKTGRIRTSLRALPDLAAVVWRVGEVAGRERVAARRRCKDAKKDVVLFCCKGSRQPVGILGAGYLLGGCWEKGEGFRRPLLLLLDIY